MNNCITISNSFLTMLTRAWPASERQFSAEDEQNYHNLIYEFCNILHSQNLTEDKQDIVFSFIRSSIFNFSDSFIVSPAVRDNHIKEVSFLVILIKEVSFYFHGAKVKTFFKDIINEIISFSAERCPEDARAIIYDFYDRTGLFEQLCASLFHLCDYSIEEEKLSSLMKTLHRIPQENIFAFFLYPFNNSYFRKNHKIYPDECTPRELYYGIYNGFFSYSPYNNVHSTLISLCDNVDDETASLGNLNNPIYVLWKIYIDGRIHSIVEYHSYIERMFRH